jgi:hypothetical protein
MIDLNQLSIPIDEIKLDNSGNFLAMIIKPNSISHFDFNSPSYLNDIFENNHQLFDINPNNFMQNIGSKLDINKFKKNDKLNTVKNNIFYQNKEFLFEILFIDLDEDSKNQEDLNELASLINIEGEQIYGSAIILKTHLPVDNLEMRFVNVELKDIIECLSYRREPMVVILEDGEYYEQRIQDLELFAGKFFGDEFVDKKEYGIIQHNLNIWYSKSDFGEKLTNLVDVKVDKAIFFSYLYQNYRCDITLDEVKKLISLASKNKFTIDNNLLNEETDEIGRVIIKNKFRILNMMYNNINI